MSRSCLTVDGRHSCSVQYRSPSNRVHHHFQWWMIPIGAIIITRSHTFKSVTPFLLFSIDRCAQMLGMHTVYHENNENRGGLVISKMVCILQFYMIDHKVVDLAYLYILSIRNRGGITYHSNDVINDSYEYGTCCPRRQPPNTFISCSSTNHFYRKQFGHSMEVAATLYIVRAYRVLFDFIGAHTAKVFTQLRLNTIPVASANNK